MTSRHRPASPQASVPRVADASMTLLNEVIRRPLDPGYAMVAERSRRDGSRRVSGPRRAVLLLTAVGLGLATTAATLALRAPEPSVLAARTLLEEQIAERTDAVERLRAENAERNQQIADLQAAVLAAEDSELLGRIAADSLVTGAVPVTGPGLRITVEDGPARAPGEETLSRVQDQDLQLLVNGLWSVGAEAVAVDGQRLTATTAIRSAGSAILVDLVPLTGPYVVEAIGDAQRMQTGLARSGVGAYLSGLTSSWGIGVDISSETGLELAPASRLSLRAASVPLDVPLLGGSATDVGTGTPTGTVTDEQQGPADPRGERE